MLLGLHILFSLSFSDPEEGFCHNSETRSGKVLSFRFVLFSRAHTVACQKCTFTLDFPNSGFPLLLQPGSGYQISYGEALDLYEK